MNNHISHIRQFCFEHKKRLQRHALSVQSASVAAIFFFVAAAVQIWFSFFPWTMLTLVWDLSVIGFLCSLMVAAFNIYIRKPISLKTTAHALERSLPNKHQTLSVALELLDNPNESNPLWSMAIENAAQSLILYPKTITPRFSLKKIVPLSLSALLCFVSMFATANKCFSYWQLPFSYFQTINLTVSPGTVHIAKGKSCVLRCAAANGKYPSGTIALSSFGNNTLTEKLLVPDSVGNFSLRIDSVVQSFTYTFSIGKKQTVADTIFVAQKPLVSGLSVRLVPPSYTGLKPAIIADGQGNFAAYPGTKAFVRLESSNPLRTAACVFASDDSLQCSVLGMKASGEFMVKNHSSYTFSLVDTFGQKSDSLPFFSIEIIEDLAPTISFIKPHANKTCDPSVAETLMIEAIDDIGIKDVSVFARKNREQPVLFSDIKPSMSQPLQKAMGITVRLNFQRFSLYPNDTLFYWASAQDNRAYGGPQKTSTDTFFFRVPSFDEIHEQIANEQDATEQTMRSVKKKQDDIQKSVASLLQTTKNKQSLSWEQKQIAKDLQNAVNAQTDSLQKALDSFKEAVDNIKKQQSMPQELLNKMNQIQQELEALRKQFGDSLLFAKSKTEETISMEDLKKSLEQFKSQMPELSQRLDNALKFIAMMKRDGELAKLASEARELAKQQHDIATMPQNNAECKAKQKDQTSAVGSLLSKIDAQANQKPDSALFGRKDLPSLSKLKEQQSAMRSQMSSSQMPQASKQEEMSATLSSLADDLMNLQSTAMTKKMESDRRILLSMAHDALSLSDWQHMLNDNVNEPNSEAGDIATTQTAVKSSLQNSSGKLDSLAMTSPQSMVAISKAYGKCIADIDANLGFLSSSNAPMLSTEPQNSMNELAKTIFDALNAMANNQGGQSGGASSMMQGMRKLSQKQASLNSLTGELLQRMLGKGSSQGESGNPQFSKNGQAGGEAARSEAQAQQKEIADALKKLADKYGKEAGPSLDSKAKELEQEARRLAKQFDSPSPELVDRQDKFLSRMLETTLSQHKQDEGKEDRTSTSAKNIFSESTPASPASANRGADKFYRMRQKAFMGIFPEAYRFSVKNYFDSLGVLYLK